MRRKDLARLLGIATRTLSNLESDGVIMPAERGRGGRPSLYDISVCVPAYVKHLQASGPTDDRAARARRDLSQAKLSELRLRREQGELVDRDDVIRAGITAMKGWTSLVRALPRRARQAAIIGTAEQETALAGLCREIQTEIASWKSIADVELSTRKADAA